MKNINELNVQEVLKTEKVKKQKGATLVEYALVVAGITAIAVVLFGDGTTKGTASTAIETKVTDALK